MIQLPPILYAVAEEIDGKRGYDEIAKRLTERLERGVSPENARLLVEEKLAPLGVAAQPDGSSPQLQKADPLLGLKLRTAVIPKNVSRALTRVFYPFFFPPVVVAVLAAVVAVDIWFFFIHGAAQSTRQLLYNPLLLLMVLGLVVLATALHEIGHATAARYGGAEPGVMGVGIYIVWPAFYTDVTDAYRLSRAGRLRVDLGGVYFNGLFILAIAGAYALTGFEPLLVLIVLQHLQVLQQFLPFLRLDGYYILSDLTGVPDMFQRLKPTLRSMLPWKKTDEEADQLKPWVRWTITAWVIALIPVLLLTFGLLIFNAPRMAATAWDSFLIQVDRVSSAVDDGDALTGVVGSMQATFLMLPLAGLSVTFGRIAKRVGTGAWGWSADSPLRRGAVLATGTAAAALMAWIWLPNGDYRPIQPGERGTLQGGIAQVSEVPTGRPALTEERERELGGAPTKRSTDEEDPAPTDEPADTEPGATTPTTTEPTGTITTPTETTPPAAPPPATPPASPAPTTTEPTPTATTTTPAETTPPPPPPPPPPTTTSTTP
jgi:putative peptide zinc metalloprotease protein